ncbi:MAG: peptidylprolyl isomerase [Calditrichia bacterium]
MKRFFAVLVLISAFIMACGTSNESAKLEKGTPAYDLAKAVSEKVPYMNPDKNNVLVKTNNFAVTTAEVFHTIQSNYGNRASQLQNLDSARIAGIIEGNARQIAEKKLLLSAVQKSNMTASSAEIDSVMNLQYMRAGGKTAFLKMIESNGVDTNYIKTQISEGVTIQKFLDNKLGEETKVTEDDIQKAYNEDKTATVRHILLSTQGKSDSAKQEIRKNMEDILARARKGEDFAKLAKEYSEDPGSKDKGGLYENFGRGQMVKPFEDAAFSVPVGQISDIIETQYGFHILKVIDRKKESKPLEEVRAQLEEKIKRTKQQEAYQTYMDGLKDKVGFKEIEF